MAFLIDTSVLVDAEQQGRRLELFSMEPLPITTRIARAHAEIWARLEQAGSLVGAHDLWIAATALAHGLSLATLNARDFERVPGLSVAAL